MNQFECGGARPDGTAAGATAPNDEGACSGSESFALRVLGEDMAPEFLDGEIIVIEPGGVVRDGSFVLARHQGEWLFRQLRREGEGWQLRALNPACPVHAVVPLPDLAAVHGVVIQKAVPGRRRLSRFYR
ncbi:MAG: S24 family peptidase [Rubrivivax sp.]|nr:S24 family peptidase [Rubrivivax sp.]